MPFNKLNLLPKIQGGTYIFDDPKFFLSQYFKCKQADIELILNKVSKNYCLQLSLAPEKGGGEGFHIRFLCKRGKRYVEFGI